MEIRPVEENDRKGIINLVLDIYKEASFAITFSSEPSAESLDMMLREKFWMVSSGRAIDYVAVDGGSIIGECEVIKEGSIGKVGILVAKGYRKKGIGSVLLKKCEEDAKWIGVRRLEAEIAVINIAARSFFEASGFSITDSESIIKGGAKIIRAEKILDSLPNG